MARKTISTGFADCQNCIREIKADRIYPIYLLSGDEPYLQDRIVEALQSACLSPESEALDLFKYRKEGSGPALDLATLKLHVQTPAFFSKRRLFLLYNTQWFEEGSAKNEELKTFINELPDTVTLVFLEEKVDGRQKRLLDRVKERGLYLKLNRQSTDTLIKWVQQRAKRLGFELDPTILPSLIERHEQRLYALDQELKKFALYLQAHHETYLSAEKVDLLSKPDISGRVFDLADHLINGQIQAAYELLNRLLDQPQPVLLLLSLLSRQTKQLLLARQINDRQKLAAHLQISPYIATRLQKQASRLPEEQWLALYEACFQTDWSIKRGGVPERLGLELLLGYFADPPKLVLK